MGVVTRALFVLTGSYISIPCRYDWESDYYELRIPFNKFQFLVGTIGRNAISYTLEHHCRFQFLVGTIGRSYSRRTIIAVAKFQFLVGTIGSSGKM